MRLEFDLKRAFTAIADVEAAEISGRVLRMVGGVVEASGPKAAIGELCTIEVEAKGGAEAIEIQGSRFIAGLMTQAPEGKMRIPVEVIGFRSDAILLMPLTSTIGIRPGDLVSTTRRPLSVGVGDELLGRVLGGLGQPIDGKGVCRGADLRPLTATSPAPLDRPRIREQLITGVRAIDGLLCCGKGQRLGIFAGSGVGKSVLLGSIARHARADVNVIALIGERGREVREFLERDLGDGLAKSVVVVATSDQPALVRIRGAMAALTIAEYFRGQGRDVLFMMDSLTRVAMAQREIGLAAGEPPTTKGYPPSVFSTMPALLERVGNAGGGSITGLFAVLVEADDMNEPISDAARSILDGHVALSRRLAQVGHYPAINVLESVSRVMPEIVSSEKLREAEAIRRVLAIHSEAEDVINLGAYVGGSNPAVDNAIDRLPGINEFLCQQPEEMSTQDETFTWLEQLANATHPSTPEPQSTQASAVAGGFRPLGELAPNSSDTRGTVAALR